MNIREFLQKIEGYYGAYPEDRPDVRDVVGQYLESKIPEEHLGILFAETVLTVTGRYRQPPDVAEFEKVRISAITRPKEVPLALPDPEDSPTDEEQEDMSERLHDFVASLSQRKAPT